MRRWSRADATPRSREICMSISPYFPPRVNPDKMFIMSGVAARIKKVVGRFFFIDQLNTWLQLTDRVWAGHLQLQWKKYLHNSNAVSLTIEVVKFMTNWNSMHVFNLYKNVNAGKNRLEVKLLAKCSKTQVVFYLYTFFTHSLNKLTFFKHLSHILCR